MDRLSLGKLGERIAANYLSSRGYRIIEMNFYKRWGEIDIVARDDDTLVFVEVKTRMVGDRISPEESITAHKINSLKKSALFYKMKHPELPEALRIDFVGIELDEGLKAKRINLIKNITG
ncbi:MAG TPA: YraN family protein [Patescibacteria group bacterium]|nr:YraN family protein [Patescibacteria group bacterium]